MYHMPGCIARQLVTARQLDSFLRITTKAFTRLFFGSINKSGIYTTFLYFCAVCIRFLVHPGAQLSAVCLIMAYSTQGTTKRGIKYLLSITSLDNWAYIVFML